MQTVPVKDDTQIGQSLWEPKSSSSHQDDGSTWSSPQARPLLQPPLPASLVELTLLPCTFNLYLFVPIFFYTGPVVRHLLEAHEAPSLRARARLTVQYTVQCSRSDAAAVHLLVWPRWPRCDRALPTTLWPTVSVQARRICAIKELPFHSFHRPKVFHFGPLLRTSAPDGVLQTGECRFRTPNSGRTASQSFEFLIMCNAGHDHLLLG